MWAGEGFCPAVQFVGLSCSSSCRNPFYEVSSPGASGSIPPWMAEKPGQGRLLKLKFEIPQNQQMPGDI